jgi:hypothetical protein
MRAVPRVLVIGLSLLLASSFAMAEDPAFLCARAKSTAAAREGRALMVCRAKAASADTAPDAGCLMAAHDRLVADFAAAESAGGCAASADAAPIASIVENFSGQRYAALGFSPGKCGARKLKLAGRYLGKLLRLFVRNQRSPLDLDAAIAARAARLSRAYTRVEGAGGCTTIGDAGPVSTHARDVAAQVSGMLFPECGNDVRNPGEDCDGSDALDCPGLCTPDCTCPDPGVCGNDVREPGEDCDGTHAGVCSPGQCGTVGDAACHCCVTSACGPVLPGCCGDAYCISGPDISPGQCVPLDCSGPSCCVAAGNTCHYNGFGYPCCSGSCVVIFQPGDYSICM